MDKPGRIQTSGFFWIFSGLVIGGALIAYALTVREQRFRREAANRTSSPTTLAATTQSERTASADSSGGVSSSRLPAGHPRVEIPAEALRFIHEIEQKAQNNPNDIKAWNRWGDVAARAALFDPSYAEKAEAAYSHVLKLDPDNLNALRGLGNVEYDRHEYDQATAAYEHYLKEKPDDPEVLTDLGTMYLYTGNADQAIALYRKAIARKPDFFEGYYNLGIAYSQLGDAEQALIALNQALNLAPDDDSRTRIQGMIASLGPEGSKRVKGSEEKPGPRSPENFTVALDQALRGLPVAGRKVLKVQWPSQHQARVLMDNFPMDKMPPFARKKFLSDLADVLQQTKKRFNVGAQIKLEIADAASGKVMETVSR